MITYDEDGNITNDGVWTYEWDAENRLVAMQTTADAVSGGVPGQRLEFKYDYMHRRVEKLVRGGWNGASFATITYQKRFLYDGWSMVGEFTVTGGTTLALARSFTWGLDIARSLTDAGGVGALLQIANHLTGKTYLPSYDGNGNIVALFDAEASSSATACVAAYEYSPYGEFLRSEGTYAKENPFRFSTKFTDDETGLVDYGRRYYSPSQGRFLGRDPIEETGGLNLYGFCGNNSINRWDYLGMMPEGDGELGENKNDSDGREWIFTRYGWVMTADGTGEGQNSGVGDIGFLGLTVYENGQRTGGTMSSSEVDDLVAMVRADGGQVIAGPSAPARPRDGTATIGQLRYQDSDGNWRYHSNGELVAPNNAGTSSSAWNGNDPRYGPNSTISGGTTGRGMTPGEANAVMGVTLVGAGVVGGAVSVGGVGVSAIVAGARPIVVAVQVGIAAYGPVAATSATAHGRFWTYQFNRARAAFTELIRGPRLPPPPAAPPPGGP